MITLAILFLTFQLQCEAVNIITNGVQAFAAGVPRIGPFTNVQDYLFGNEAYPFGGLDYIEARCGVRLGPGLFLTTEGGD